jgi:putative serine protease PepD
MPDPDPGLSRLCRSCGRRVPTAVVTCRCGADVPADAEDAADDRAPGSGGRSVTNLAVGALLLAAVIATGYWSLSPPAAPEAVIPIAQPATSAGTPPSPPSTPAAGTEVSAERRAWDTSAAAAGATAPTLTAAPEPATPAAPTAPAVPSSLEDVVGRVMPAVVLVETSSGRGSGFFVRPDTIITNVHVVKNDGFVQLRRVDGTTVSARVDLRSPAFDIAILKVATPLPGQVVIPMGTAETLRPGQEVITIGSALGTLQNSVSRGIVSGVRRSGEATLVQTDAAANPGNSGGPLLDRSGVAIGITTMGYRDQQGLNFAVAIDHARALIDGRVASSQSAPLAMNEVKALMPAVASEAERALEEGQRAFLTAATTLSRFADTLDGEWKRFRQSCYTSAIPGSFSHEWFVMLTPRAITTAQVPAGSCATFVTEFQQEARRGAAEMRTALEQARRAGVLPGVVRDTLRSNRLEFDGWDR